MSGSSLRTFKPKKRVVPRGRHELQVDTLADDGRGIARVKGKTVFIDGALPGETVRVEYTASGKKFDEANTVAVLKPSAQRVEPGCGYFPRCGGCQLQHLHADAQVHHQQQSLARAFARLSKTPVHWLDPVMGPSRHYRHRLRFAVSRRGGRTRVGLYQQRSDKVVAIDHCELAWPAINALIEPLNAVLSRLQHGSAVRSVAVAIGEGEQYGLEFVLGQAMPAADRQTLARWCEQQSIAAVQLRIAGRGADDTGQVIAPADTDKAALLSYPGAGDGPRVRFGPGDFTQVNPVVNDALTDRLLDWLAPAPDDVIADFFCGLGNFSLPLAARGAALTGYELMASMVEKAAANAHRHGLANVTFQCANLFELSAGSWRALLPPSCNKAVLDPPRAGARALCEVLPADQLRSLVYISCNPQTLLRDLRQLLNRGFTFEAAQLFAMFPQTQHHEVAVLLRGAAC